KRMGKNLPLALLFQAPTIAQLAEAVRNKDWENKWNSLVPIRSEGSKPPLYLIHGAEGNVLLYKELSLHLGNDQPVYGLQSRGLDGSSEMQTKFENMASSYIKEIKQIQPNGPYMLAGYCLGGAIAYEIANQLKHNGDEVLLLAMFETFNNHSIIDKIPSYFGIIHFLQKLYFHLENFFLSSKLGSTNFLKNKVLVEFSRFRVRTTVFYSSILKRMNPSIGLRFHHLEINKVNDKAQADYVPKNYSGQIVLFKPMRDFAGMTDEYFGWGSLAEAGVKIVNVPADPRGMMVNPFVKILAKKLTQEIDYRLKHKNGTHQEIKDETEKLEESFSNV
ncbi:MAG: thioesterase domain-containing protein, partial [Ignavibacteriaceae bacterium]|nr:thioesterase domain-containing protein [Ignavibacteriaceae bacterium]